MGFVLGCRGGDSLSAEILAMTFGILLLLRRSICPVYCESNCLEIVKVLKGNNRQFHASASAVQYIHLLLSKDWVVRLCNIP